MILKNNNLTIDIQKTKDNIGLNNNDYWYQIEININNETIKEKMLTNTELNDIITKLKELTETKKRIKERIRFTKNYLILYLEKNTKRSIAILKIIYPNKQKKSKTISFENKEINSLLKQLQSKKD